MVTDDAEPVESGSGRWAHWLAYLLVRSVICFLQALSLESCAAASNSLGWLFGDLLPVRRGVIDDNLRHAYPELGPAERDRLRRRMWSHLFLFVAEVAHLPRKVHETNWRDHVRLVDQDLIVRALLSDRPVMLISGHFGNFELAGYVLGLLGFPTFSVARDLDNPYLHEFVNDFRGRTGQYIIPKKGGYEQILAALAARGAMAFLADQYAGAKGCWVTFFGRPASTHKAIALLALEHQARVFVGSARRAGAPLQYVLEIGAEADTRSGRPEVSGVRELTGWYTGELERLIRRAPEQYWWLHRRWKDSRPAARRRRAA